MKANIDSYDFWRGVDELIDMLKPIHEAQISSESSNGRLDYVAMRWRDLRRHLRNHRHGDRLKEVFRARNRVQVEDCHQFAYLMNPQHVDKAMNANEQTKMFTFIKTHLNADDYIEAQAQFLNYRRKDEGFDNKDLWDERVTRDPERYEIEVYEIEI